VRFGCGAMVAMLLRFPVRLAEPARRVAGAGRRGSRGDVVGRVRRTGRGGTAGLAWSANDRCTAAGDPPCAAMTAAPVAQPTMAAAPASTKTPVRKRTSSSQV
jgi:hypothetical protein